jgi:hypothetical protein
MGTLLGGGRAGDLEGQELKTLGRGVPLTG